jgi:murein DD-endopeptidase MepM/ murein hydrolase activator NlpD
MAHFNMTIADFASGNSVFAKVVENQKNYTPTGQPKALVTSESKEEMPKKGLTTFNVSDILQNQLTFKDQGLVQSRFNEVLSTDMARLLDSKINGKKPQLSRANALLLGYDIPSASSIETLELSTNPVNGSPSSQPRPTMSGFVFPLKTTKSAVRNGVGGISWNSENQNNIHHSYNAADIFAEPGTTVVAAMGGKLISVNNNGGSFGSSVRIQGQDGFWYYYTHMGSGTLTVTLGQQITSGTILGKVGSSSEAQNTTPHLHFDVSPQENGFSRGYGFANGPLINPQPMLIEAFQLLPE